MTPFEYLSVLISVIIGLGISHLLTGVARLIQRRHAIRLYLPTLLWMVTLFLVQVQIWWVAFDSREEAQWNFFSFLFYLLIPVIAYLLSYLVIPDLEADKVDLRASYHRNRAWFFGLFAAAVVVSLSRDLVTDGLVALDLDAAFRTAFLVFSLAAILVRREWFHVANAVLGLLLFCAYIFILFIQLS